MTITTECAPLTALPLLRQSESVAQLDYPTVVPEFAPLPTAPDLAAEVLDSWHTNIGGAVQYHEAQRLALPGRHHQMLHTESASGDSDAIVVANLPGWTETINGKVLRQTQAYLSHQLPEFAIDTHATYGTDSTLPRQALHYLGGHTLDLAAQETFNVLAPLYDGKRIVVVATSMSAAILARMDKINDDQGQPINIIGRVLYEPCLVSSKRARLHMFTHLPGHLVLGVVDEITRQNSPHDAARLIYDNLHSLPPGRDLAVIARLGLSLLGGTSRELLDILAVRNAYLIQSERDPVRGHGYENRSNGVVEILKDRSHCMAGESAERAAAIGRAIRTLGVSDN